jgi:hypothetical protein
VASERKKEKKEENIFEIERRKKAKQSGLARFFSNERVVCVLSIWNSLAAVCRGILDLPLLLL